MKNPKLSDGERLLCSECLDKSGLTYSAFIPESICSECKRSCMGYVAGVPIHIKPSPKINPWTVESDPKTLHRLGKTMEELGECTAATARCLVQGINESEPVTGKPNKQWLQDEMADVLAQIELNIRYFELDHTAIQKRMVDKMGQMADWEDHFK